MDIKNETVYNDVEYELYIDGLLTVQKGVWLLCDGGYHKWVSMINPMKHTSERQQRLWSEWMESTRKDVECCFGILKSRFRILCQGFLFQSSEPIDAVFYTCCILHNMLLEFDNLDCRWEKDVDWELLNPQADNDDTNYDIDGLGGDVRQRGQQEQRILNRVAEWESAVEFFHEDNEVDEEIDVSFEDKRERLLRHFHTKYEKGLVSWPKGFCAVKKQIYNKGKDA
jgi:hypothetical protein